MLTADKSSHSAAGMLRSHCSATFFLYVILCCLSPPPKILPLPIGDPSPSIKEVIHWLTWLTTPNDIIGIHTWTSIAVIYVRWIKRTCCISNLNVITDAHTMHKQWHAKFSHRLAQVAYMWVAKWLNHAKKHESCNDIETSHHACSLVNLLHCPKFLEFCTKKFRNFGNDKTPDISEIQHSRIAVTMLSQQCQSTEDK